MSDAFFAYFPCFLKKYQKPLEIWAKMVYNKMNLYASLCAKQK